MSMYPRMITPGIVKMAYLTAQTRGDNRSSNGCSSGKSLQEASVSLISGEIQKQYLDVANRLVSHHGSSIISNYRTIK